MAGFTVSQIDLTMKDPTTDQLLTANVYTVPGVNGNQPISIGGLVMALCLARATELEKSIIDIMKEMEETSADLEHLTSAEEKVIDGRSGAITPDEWSVLNKYGISANVSDIESTMDSLNSFSQQIMIELQSQTNKRDQAYDMVANILKSLNTTLVGTVNNL